jgi:hypothetical protein
MENENNELPFEMKSNLNRNIKRIEALTSENTALRNELESLRYEIGKYKKVSEDQRMMRWGEIIINILAESNQPLRIFEIGSLVMQNFPFKTLDTTNLDKAIENHLYRLKSQRRIIVFKWETRLYWLLPAWMSDEFPKAEFMPFII